MCKEKRERKCLKRKRKERKRMCEEKIERECIKRKEIEIV